MASVRLARVNSLTITKDGSVVEAVDVSGNVTISASNVTLRNFRVRGGEKTVYGVKIDPSCKAVVLEDGEITGARSAGVYGGGFTAQRLNVHHIGNDGFKATGDVAIEGCWVHHIGTMPKAHADGVQITAGAKFVFRGNNFDLPAGLEGHASTSAFMIQSDDGKVDEVLIENNWLNGGSHTVYVRDKKKGHGPPKNVRVVGNRFGRDFRYGVRSVSENARVVWSNNSWDETAPRRGRGE